MKVIHGEMKESIVDRDPSSDDIASVPGIQTRSEEFEVDPLPVHLVYLSRGTMPIKLRRFIDFAVPKLRETLAEFGRIPST